MQKIIKKTTILNGKKVSPLVLRSEFPSFENIDGKILQLGIPYTNNIYYKLQFYNSIDYNFFIDSYLCKYNQTIRSVNINPWKNYEYCRYEIS